MLCDIRHLAFLACFCHCVWVEIRALQFLLECDKNANWRIRSEHGSLFSLRFFCLTQDRRLGRGGSLGSRRPGKPTFLKKAMAFKLRKIDLEVIISKVERLHPQPLNTNKAPGGVCIQICKWKHIGLSNATYKQTLRISDICMKIEKVESCIYYSREGDADW